MTAVTKQLSTCINKVLYASCVDSSREEGKEKGELGQTHDEMYLLVKIHCKFDRKEQLPCLSVYQTTMGAPNQAVSRWSDRCGNHISSE